ncbi:T3SS effector HopA1 family protein [Rathayibacter sp. AY2B3]|uniref:T3SS effector HopA1 family protein n=1 Tax=Rathayibacter sp. AY2B3 TaxID=2080569 RepID=UPI0011AFD8E6|nr:T3SS effector HopA1 family protein [Rathayibacter sp. AY2B3]
MNRKIIDVLTQVKNGLDREDESRLTSDLYDLLHLRRNQAPGPMIPAGRILRAKDIFGHQLRVEDGWRRAPSPRPDALVFERGGLHILVAKEEITADGCLRLPAIRDRFTPGFCALLSADEPAETGTRIYLAVHHEHANRVGRYLSKALPRLTDRFVVKALTDRKELVRPDSFTIYVGNEARDAVLEAVNTDEIRNGLDPNVETSLFARAEQPGISWMEGRARTSAGEERAHCVARALRTQPGWDRDILMRVVAHEFRSGGFVPERPYRLLPAEDSGGN